MRRMIFPLALGVCGVVLLCALGMWQLRRLEWKEAMLAQIRDRIDAPAVELPARPDPPSQKYLPVTVSGETGPGLLVLSGRAGQGAGYEVISALTMPDGRRVMVDRGFVPEAARNAPRPPVALRITGNLHWPQEATDATPPPGQGIWFARDVPAMAAALSAEPALVVARRVEGDNQGADPVPVSTAGIPNSHLGYAIQWFSLAAVWAGMTAYLLWRISRKSV